MRSVTKLDEIDRRLLNLLQKDCQIPVIELAAELGISTPTCHRRIKQLRSNGVIERQVAIADPSQSTRPLLVFVEVSLQTHDAAAIDRFQMRMCAEEDVTQCFNVNGEVDFLVALNVASVESYYQASRELFGGHPDVKSYRSFVVIKRAKFDPKLRF